MYHGHVLALEPQLQLLLTFHINMYKMTSFASLVVYGSISLRSSTQELTKDMYFVQPPAPHTTCEETLP